MPEKDDADEGDDNAFLDQLATKGRDRVPDQLAAIVGGNDLHAGRQGAFDFFQLFFNAVDDGKRVFAVTHDDDSADSLAFAIEFRDAAPNVAPEMHRTDILHVNRRAVRDFQGDVFDVCDAFDVAAPAHEVFRGRDFKYPATDIGVACLDRAHDVGQRNAVAEKFVRIEIDLVLLHEAADRRDFCHAFHR